MDCEYVLLNMQFNELNIKIYFTFALMIFKRCLFVDEYSIFFCK